MEDFSSQATPVEPVAPKAPDFSAYASPVYDPHSLAQARVIGNIGTNPEQAAQGVKLARQVQLPVAAVETDPRWFQDQATAQKNSQIVSSNPAVARWVAANPDGARVANDDFENLSAIGKAARYVANAGRSIGAGIQSFNTGAWGAAAFGAEAVGLDTIGGFLLDRAKAAKNVEQAIGPQDMARMGLIERSINTGFQSVGSNLATLPIGFIGAGATAAQAGLTAAERVMLGMMGVTTGGQSYLKGREAGLNPWQAGAYGVADATAEIVGERFLGSVGFLRNIRAGSSFGKLLQYEMTKEVKGEVATTVWQNFNEWMSVNPDKPIGDWLNEQPAAIAETVIATLVGGGVMSGAVRGTQKLAQIATRDESRVDASAQAAQTFAQLSELSAASKVLQRDTETFESFVKTVTEDGGDTLYISPQALMQSGVAEAMAAASPEIAAQLPEAMQNGTDIRISTAEYLGRFTLDGTAQKLAEDIKIEQGGFSAKEAQAYMAENGDRMQAEVDAVLTAMKADDSVKASRQVVQDDLLQKLNATQRFTPEVNKSYATLMANFFATQANRLGITPEEMYRRYEPRIVAEGTGAAGFDALLHYGPGDKRHILVMAPEQIKSAIGNNGQFDPNNPSILRQEAQQTVKPSPEEIALRKREAVLKRLLECVS